MWPWTGYGNTKQWGFFFSIIYGLDLFLFFYFGLWLCVSLSIYWVAMANY